MKNLISAMIDGKLSGLIHKYALYHVANCPRCLAALNALKALHGRLERLGPSIAPTLSPQHHNHIMSALDDIDNRIR